MSILFDGYHRMKAYLKYNEGYADRLATLKEGETIPDVFETIPCEYHKISEGIPVKLYALSLSTKHGLRVADADRRETAREIYENNLGFPMKRLIEFLGVTHRKARDYFKDLLAKFEDDKNSVIIKLKMLGWSQEEISEKIIELWPDAKGTSRQSVSDFITEFLPENGNSNFLAKITEDLTRGHPVEKVAQRHALPPILVWAIKLQSLDDQAKMETPSIKIQPYDVWHFNSCNPLFGAEHPGRIPGELVAHALPAPKEPAGTDKKPKLHPSIVALNLSW
jgi:hypothetical protein